MKKFLIYYQAGARGDFLANILLDNINYVNRNYYKLPAPDNRYIKVHNLNAVGDMYNTAFDDKINKFESYDDMFAYCREQGIITIRIVSRSRRDYKNIAYFCDVKSRYHYITGPEYAVPFSKSRFKFTNIKDINIQIHQDSLDLNYRHLYDHRVFFSNLFNIEFLKRFYFKIHNTPINETTLTYIQDNINLSKRYTEAKYLYE